MEDQVQKTIAEDVRAHKVLLYVKGSRQMPQCGFSKAVMDTFDKLGVVYETRDVLADASLREGVKQFTNWPTIPQIFIGGKFIGGCDIVRDMYAQGELQKLFAN